MKSGEIVQAFASEKKRRKLGKQPRREQQARKKTMPVAVGRTSVDVAMKKRPY